jgi:hypothetical protein
MRISGSGRKGWTTGLAMLALLAFFCQGLIPAGLMPDAARHSVFALTICSGAGARTISVPADKYGPAVDHAPVHGKIPPCPFAAASFLFFTGQAGPSLASFFPSAAPLPILQAAAVSTVPHFGNASPRSPPA